MRWRWTLPLLVFALVSGVLVLHQLSHGRSLVTTDAPVAGHHVVASTARAVTLTSVATATEHHTLDQQVIAGTSSSGDMVDACGAACSVPAVAMICLLALVLLVGRLLLRAPPEVWWWAVMSGRLPAVQPAPGRAGSSTRSAVCLRSLGISRT